MSPSDIRSIEIINQMQDASYNFAAVWNEALLQRDEPEPKPRQFIRASELGKARVDIFLAMKGEKPSNPPNARSLRKFEAGHIWEWIASLILHRAGILEEQQTEVRHQYPGLLEVVGHPDFICSGRPSLEFAESEIETLALPEVFLRSGRAIAKHLVEGRMTIGADGSETDWQDRVIEFKSCSAFMFDARERKQCASANHKLQIYHYLKALGLSYGEIVYVCKDDCRMMEFVVQCPSSLEAVYFEEIAQLTFSMARDIRPALEQEIVFDADIGKFAANWKVAYSNYLTRLYTYRDQAAFDEKNKPIVARWNRVLGRMARKEKMTPKNQSAILEMHAAGFNPDELVIAFAGEGEESEES